MGPTEWCLDCLCCPWESEQKLDCASFESGTPEMQRMLTAVIYDNVSTSLSFTQDCSRLCANTCSDCSLALSLAV